MFYYVTNAGEARARVKNYVKMGDFEKIENYPGKHQLQFFFRKRY